jgi:fructuronate reductase
LPGSSKGCGGEEIIPSFKAPDGVDLEAYADALFERYSNTAIRHRTWQIAMDGSQKLPQRILGTISDNLSAGGRARGLCSRWPGWMRYVGGIDEKGEPIEVKDPLAGDCARFPIRQRRRRKRSRACLVSARFSARASPRTWLDP